MFIDTRYFGDASNKQGQKVYILLNIMAKIPDLTIKSNFNNKFTLTKEVIKTLKR